MNTFHYSDKNGWNAIRSQKVWFFKAFQPNDPDRPVGAYFTDLPPTEEILRTIYQRLRLPNKKKEYIFWFTERHGLVQVRNGRGRDRHIYYSPSTYYVAGKNCGDDDRQLYEGESTGISDRF